jgi:hypothetical protein
MDSGGPPPLSLLVVAVATSEICMNAANGKRSGGRWTDTFS